MSRLFLSSLIIVALALFSPLFFLPKDEQITPEETASPSPKVEIAERDSEYSFTAKINGQTQTVTMDEYLAGAIAAEMPALFETEALKAQAVAIRTYIMSMANYENPNHPDADVCDDPYCCKGYLTDEELHDTWGEDYNAYKNKLALAVSATDGQYLSYDGQAIQAVFHAGSIGKTEDSSAIWADFPYLTSVESPETEESVQTLVTSVRFSAEEFMQALALVYPAISLSDDPATWLGEITYTDSGRVDELIVGDIHISGNDARGIFSLRSTDFDVQYEDECFVFTVRGYGHGVGMSQQGANLYAKDGMSYSEILAHYYSGAELVGW